MFNPTQCISSMDVIIMVALALRHKTHSKNKSFFSKPNARKKIMSTFAVYVSA